MDTYRSLPEGERDERMSRLVVQAPGARPSLFIATSGRFGTVTTWRQA